MKDLERAYCNIGLALKAGKLVLGAHACEEFIKNGKAILVIVANDASSNTKKKFNDMCEFYNTEIRFFGDKETLGRYLGKENKTIAAVTDLNLSKLIACTIDSIENLTGVKDIEKN